MAALPTWADESADASHELQELQAALGPTTVARRFIPSEKRRQGEIRLVVHGTERRVQILLYTSSLGRALREMRKSEHANWPAGKAWHPHSVKFLETLDAFRQYLRDHTEPAGSEDAPRYHIMIEFVCEGDDSSVRFSEVQYEGAPEALQAADHQVYTQLDLSGNYVNSNQYILIRDGFELTAEQASALMYRDE